jgi:hypothetical protein
MANRLAVQTRASAVRQGDRRLAAQRPRSRPARGSAEKPRRTTAAVVLTSLGSAAEVKVALQGLGRSLAPRPVAAE